MFSCCPFICVCVRACVRHVYMCSGGGILRLACCRLLVYFQGGPKPGNLKYSRISLNMVRSCVAKR